MIVLPKVPNWIPTVSRLYGFVWATRVALAAGGLPDIGLFYKGGLGDEIMRTAVARELKKRGSRRIWQFTSVAELYIGNPDLIPVADDFRLRRLCQLFGIPCVELDYPERPIEHFIATMCRAAGIRGKVDLRPYIVLSDHDRRAGVVASRPQVAIQTSSLAARYPMRNKLWPSERFQIVADALSDDFDLVHLGSVTDLQLRGVIDLRGRTSVREAAGILSSSRVFVGLATGLVHLARAVECRSVVIYGGREDPSKSGYSANENICWTAGPCAPCWLRNDCSFERICMSEILPNQVIAAVRRQAARYGSPLAVDSIEISSGK